MSAEDLEAEGTVPEATFEYFLTRCRAVTVAMQDKLGTWEMSDQIAHAHSEVSEVYQAIRHGETNTRVLEEICDSMLSALTMAHVAGFTDAEIMCAMEETTQKIERRAGLRK